jgi:hypothetical protein
VILHIVQYKVSLTQVISFRKRLFICIIKNPVWLFHVCEILGSHGGECEDEACTKRYVIRTQECCYEYILSPDISLLDVRHITHCCYIPFYNLVYNIQLVAIGMLH